MFNHVIKIKSPITGEWKLACFLDDYFGKYQYGIQFVGENKVYNQEEYQEKYKVAFIEIKSLYEV